MYLYNSHVHVDLDLYIDLYISLEQFPVFILRGALSLSLSCFLSLSHLLPASFLFDLAIYMYRPPIY